MSINSIILSAMNNSLSSYPNLVKRCTKGIFDNHCYVDAAAVLRHIAFWGQLITDLPDEYNDTQKELLRVLYGVQYTSRHNCGIHGEQWVVERHPMLDDILDKVRDVPVDLTTTSWGEYIQLCIDVLAWCQLRIRIEDASHFGEGDRALYAPLHKVFMYQGMFCVAKQHNPAEMGLYVLSLTPTGVDYDLIPLQTFDTVNVDEHSWSTAYDIYPLIPVLN